MTTTLPVLIIGGGLSGLSLAQSLKHQGIPYQLFERDTGKDDRVNQGWSISMHFCLPGLSRAMDPTHFATLGTSASVDQKNYDDVQFSLIDGVTNQQLLTLDPKADPSKKPAYPTYRINRKRFRAWLMHGLDVTWNKRLASYRILTDDEQPGGGVEATFTDGTTARGSVLVGADGVNSAVCKQLMASAKNSDDAFQQATVVNPTRALVVLRWLTEEEYMPMRSMSKTLFIAFGALHRDTDQDQETVCTFMGLNDVDHDPNAKRKYQVILSMSRYDEAKAIPWHDDNKQRLQQLKTWAKDGFKGELQKILMEIPEGDDGEQEEEAVTYLTIRERIPDPDSLAKHQGRIALVGDAAHTMTMFRGEGGNHAILDATLLGQALGDAYNPEKEFTFFDAIQKYNEEMIPRGTKAVKESHDAAHAIHTMPETFVQHMQSMIDAAYKGAYQRK